jgi:hypothetical protein
VDSDWLTYQDLAVRLGITPEAARHRAIRGKWSRKPGNDGRTRIRPPNDWHSRGSTDVRPDASALVIALENNIKTLQAENATLREQCAAERDRSMRTLAAFSDLAVQLDALATDRTTPKRRRRRP